MAGLNFGAGIQGVGGAVDSLFAAEGKRKEAESYDVAAEMSGKNAEYTELSTAIKNTQADRDIFRKIGQQGADIAGAGFAAGGSGGDLLRSSVAQGSLTHAVISEQGLIQQEGYEAQQKSYELMGDAARTAATGADISAGFKAAAGIAGFLGV